MCVVAKSVTGMLLMATPQASAVQCSAAHAHWSIWDLAGWLLFCQQRNCRSKQCMARTGFKSHPSVMFLQCCSLRQKRCRKMACKDHPGSTKLLWSSIGRQHRLPHCWISHLTSYYLSLTQPLNEYFFPVKAWNFGGSSAGGGSALGSSFFTGGACKPTKF